MRPTKVRWLVFALACAVSWLLYLHRYAWGVVRPAVKEEFPSLTDVQLGWLDALFSAGYAPGQVPGGMAADRWGSAPPGLDLLSRSGYSSATAPASIPGAMRPSAA